MNLEKDSKQLRSLSKPDKKEAKLSLKRIPLAFKPTERSRNRFRYRKPKLNDGEESSYTKFYNETKDGLIRGKLEIKSKSREEAVNDPTFNHVGLNYGGKKTRKTRKNKRKAKKSKRTKKTFLSSIKKWKMF